MDREDIKMLVKKWWEVYEDESLDYQNVLKSQTKQETNLTPLISVLSEAEVVNHITAPSAA